MPERIPQSATIRVPLQAYLSSDHVSPATGKTIPITVSKNGAAYGNPSGGATNAVEIGNGSYYVDLSTNDTGTLGPLFVLGILTGVDNIVAIYNVVKATNAGFTAIPDTACTTNASLLTSGTGTDQISVLSGKVLLQATQTGVTIPNVTTVNTLTTYTGNTPQTGDVYSLANGSSGFVATKTDTAAIVAKLPVNAIADETLLLSAIGSPMQAGSTVVLTDASLTTAKLGTFALAKGTNITGFNDITTASVWDLATSGHTTSGSFGAEVVAAGSAGDPWATSLPGSYGVGTAGNIVGTNLNATVSSRSTYAGGSVASVTGPVTVGTNNDKTGYILGSSGLDSILVETGINARQALSPILAASAGVLSGAGTGSIIVFAGGSTSTHRIDATTDNNGNRLTVTLNLP